MRRREGQLVELEQGTGGGGAATDAQKLVVAEVHQHQVGTELGNLPGHVEAYIAGDRRQGEIDDLTSDAGPSKHLLQSEGEGLGGPVGESLTGGLTQYEDFEGPGLLVPFEEIRLSGRGNARKQTGVVLVGEAAIEVEELLLRVATGEEETVTVPDVDQSQEYLSQAEQEKAEEKAVDRCPHTGHDERGSPAWSPESRGK